MKPQMNSEACSPAFRRLERTALVIRNGDNQWRSFWGIQELTGRAGSDQLPKAIAALEARYPEAGTRPLDVCLASNILEVGIDIDRLSLMVVVGQPKTTSTTIKGSLTFNGSSGKAGSRRRRASGS